MIFQAKSHSRFFPDRMPMVDRERNKKISEDISKKINPEPIPVYLEKSR